MMTPSLLRSSLLLLSMSLLPACPAGPSATEDLASPGADLRAEGDSGGGGGTVVAVLLPDKAPVPGADVVVSDGEGAVVSSHKTGPDGLVSVSVPAGGMVAVYQNDGEARYIDAVSEPPAGARLTFRGRPKVMGSAPPTQLTLTLKGLPAGAKEVRYFSACSTGVKSSDLGTLTLLGCEVAGVYDVVAVATDGMGKRLAWGALLSQAPRPGQMVTAELVLDRTSFVQLEQEATGVPMGRRATVRLWPLSAVGQRVTALADRVSGLSPAQGILRATLTLPALSDQGYRTSSSASRELPATAEYSFQGSVTRSRSFEKLPARNSDALGAVPEVALAAPDKKDPAHPRYSWQLSAPFRGDFASLEAEYATDDGSLHFTALLPADRKPPLRLPDAPAALADYAVAAAARHTFAAVTFTDLDGVEGYGEFLKGDKVEASGGSTVTAGNANLKED